MGFYRSFNPRRAVPAGENLWMMSTDDSNTTGLFRSDGTCLVPMMYSRIELHPEGRRVIAWKRNNSADLYDYTGHRLASLPVFPGSSRYFSGKGLLVWGNGNGRFVNLEGQVFEEP